ncbi:MAG: NAD-dependent epimerase/dehydratase family protein [Humibacter sp.]
MRVFITGGTGYVGSAVVDHLLAAGHEVRALTRSQRSADAAEAAGAIAVRGSLADLDVLEASAADAEAIVYVAVDYTGTDEANATELAAIDALLRGARGSGRPRPFVYTSTGLVYGLDPAQSRDEDAVIPEDSLQPVKTAAERLVRDAQGVVPIIFRAGLVYGRGGSGLITGLIAAAEANGASTYIGDGKNTWTPIHIDDLARLYVLAIAHPVAGVYNAVGDEPFTFGALAEAIASLTGAESRSLPLDQAEAAMGPAAHLLASSSTTSAAKARAVFGWAPGGPSLIEDVRTGSYSSRSSLAR